MKFTTAMMSVLMCIGLSTPSSAVDLKGYWKFGSVGTAYDNPPSPNICYSINSTAGGSVEGSSFDSDGDDRATIQLGQFNVGRHDGSFVTKALVTFGGVAVMKFTGGSQTSGNIVLAQYGFGYTEAGRDVFEGNFTFKDFEYKVSGKTVRINFTLNITKPYGNCTYFIGGAYYKGAF